MPFPQFDLNIVVQPQLIQLRTHTLIRSKKHKCWCLPGSQFHQLDFLHDEARWSRLQDLPDHAWPGCRAFLFHERAAQPSTCICPAAAPKSLPRHCASQPTLKMNRKESLCISHSPDFEAAERTPAFHWNETNTELSVQIQTRKDRRQHLHFLARTSRMWAKSSTCCSEARDVSCISCSVARISDMNCPSLVRCVWASDPEKKINSIWQNFSGIFGKWSNRRTHVHFADETECFSKAPEIQNVKAAGTRRYSRWFDSQQSFFSCSPGIPFSREKSVAHKILTNSFSASWSRCA